MDSLHTTLILPAHARANRAARDPRSTRAAFLSDIAAIVSERSEGARGAVRERGHGFGTLKAAAERAVTLAGGVFRFGSFSERFRPTGVTPTPAQIQEVQHAWAA